MKAKVRSIPKSFRRAGMVFTEVPKVVDVEPGTLKTLQAETMLVVEVLPETGTKQAEGVNAAADGKGRKG